MKDDAFELYWQSHRRELLSKNKEYREIEESYKMRTGFDWLLWAVPLVCGILAFKLVAGANEILNWLISAAVVIVTFLLCVWIKAALSGHRSLSEVEEDVKKQAYEEFKHRLNQS